MHSESQTFLIIYLFLMYLFLTAPTKIRELTTASPPSSSTIHISWKQPIPSNGRLSNYTVQYRALNSNITSKNLSTIHNDIKITDLIPFTPYDIRVSFPNRTLLKCNEISLNRTLLLSVLINIIFFKPRTAVCLF